MISGGEVYTKDVDSGDLHARARARVDAFVSGAEPAESFGDFARALARHQAASIPGYGRLCAARGVDLSGSLPVEHIPAVPTDVFKMTRVATFPKDASRATFRTSGTTVGTRGEHEMQDVTTYDKGAIAFGRHWLTRDLGKRVPVVVLALPPKDAPDSSLGHMCELFVKELGTPAPPAKTWLLDTDGIFDLAAFDERVALALTTNDPMLVLGTSFAFVHLVDALGKDTFRLPSGSRVMQTGGYKGKSREVPAKVLRSDLARVFGVDPRAIVAEYGMTELSSQFYERTLFEPDAKHTEYAEPPWAKVVPVDPDTLEPVPHGEVGIAKIIDLLNVDSAVAVLTQDQVRRTETGFVLLGRAPGATPRGCSIAIEEILGRAGAS